jgi:hypothetical protein
MKKIFISIFISALLFISCKKNKASNESYGVLTGTDLALCPCCGGTFIKIKDSTYRIDALPANLNGPFPINVVLTYTVLPNCFGWHIKSDDIRRR